MELQRWLGRLYGVRIGGWLLAIILMCGIGLINSLEVSAVGSITMTVPSSVSLNVVPISSEGTFASTDLAFTVTSTCATGYTLGIKAKVANSNALINEDDNTKTIPSISSAVSANNYSDDAYAASHNLNNTWGYKPSMIYDPVNDTTVANANYLPAPTSVTDPVIIDKTTSIVGLKPYTVSVGTRVSSAVEVGSYKNTFVITAVANPISYSITYNKNTTDTVTGMPSNVSGSTLADTVTIGAAPVRSGYSFKGWCSTQVADGASCLGTLYSAGDTYTLDYSSNNNNLTLYAAWGEPTIYDEVAAMSKGTQTAANLKEIITRPTSSDHTLDTSNSGVYEYNENDFGVAADASKGDGTRAKIYYYRGILDSNLDNTTSTYGSNGDGLFYPNYVRIDNTCWRIVRTTASGGVKMLYNGLYSSGTTANSCANATTNAQILARPYGAAGGSTATNWYNNANRVGYTFNDSASIRDSTDETSVGTIFGDNSNYSTTNTTDSGTKTYLEDSWISRLSSYLSLFESNAGYCNDRSVFSNSAGTLEIETTAPFSTTITTYYGPQVRNRVAGGKLTLSCPRGTVDIYTTTASGGNGQLDQPIALLTLDEAALIGDGGNGGPSSKATQSSNYSYSSYARSGTNYQLLSPYGQRTNGATYSLVSDTGSIGTARVNVSIGLRPVVSLVDGVTYASGTGTATDPWVIAAPSSP